MTEQSKSMMNLLTLINLTFLLWKRRTRELGDRIKSLKEEKDTVFVWPRMISDQVLALEIKKLILLMLTKADL